MLFGPQDLIALYPFALLPSKKKNEGCSPRRVSASKISGYQKLRLFASLSGSLVVLKRNPVPSPKFSLF